MVKTLENLLLQNSESFEAESWYTASGTQIQICVLVAVAILEEDAWHSQIKWTNRVRVGGGYSEEFEVKVGVHKGSALSPLLFIIVLEALSREFRSGVSWKDLCADVVIAESLEECGRRLLTRREAIEEKGLRVNARKTKIMISGTGLDFLQSSGEDPCAVCRIGEGSNSIFCHGCKHWVHKKCSGLKRLTKDPDYRCIRCQGTARSLDGRPQRGPCRTWQARDDSFLLLPRRYAISIQRLWTFNHNTCLSALSIK